jgi:hypothetical protein
MYKETALSRKWRRLNNGASTRDCNARRSRRGTLACAVDFVSPGSKKPSHFCKGFLNNGTSTARCNRRDTPACSANLIQQPRSKKPSHFCKGFLNNGASTRDCNARCNRRDTPACSANLIQQPRSKKPRTFLFRALRIMVPRPGIEPGTRGFSIRCSTN